MVEHQVGVQSATFAERQNLVILNSSPISMSTYANKQVKVLLTMVRN